MSKKPKTKKLAKKPAVQTPAKTGRPSSYSEAIAERICTELALGRSLVTICNAADMPARQTVFRWLDADPAFRDRYARAREVQADTFADEIVDLADKAEDANLARIQIDARKWAASKQRPSKYSERVVNELTGKDGAPIAVRQIKPTMTAQEAAEIYAETLHDFPG
ncbi:MAG: terminase small subunit protein [Hyphomicrobium sp.]|nr:terminase small subunit protein [Hyphomicrobium sp.]